MRVIDNGGKKNKGMPFEAKAGISTVPNQPGVKLLLTNIKTPFNNVAIEFENQKEFREFAENLLKHAAN